jgi:hypothetical protein
VRSDPSGYGRKRVECRSSRSGRSEFSRLFGFGVEQVNYEEDVNPVVPIPGLVQV